MPRMRVLAGVCPDTLEPIEANNPERVYKLNTDKFEGEIAVFLKDFQNEHGEPSSTDYFEHPGRRSHSWSIQVRGRFLSETITGDDILFGNVFDRPLKLPYGSGMVLKLMEKKDPTLEYDLNCEKPWMMAPFISTVRYLTYTEVPPRGTAETGDPVSRLKGSPAPSPSPSALSSFSNSSIIIEEETSSIVPISTSKGRRAHFAEAENRRSVRFGPSKFIQTDFCHGYLRFAYGDGLELCLPVIHLGFDILKYWDGRPVWFLCCERREDGSPGPGEPIFCVGFEIILNDGES